MSDYLIEYIYEGDHVEVFAMPDEDGDWEVHLMVEGSPDHPTNTPMPIKELAEAKKAWIKWVRHNHATFIYCHPWKEDGNREKRLALFEKLGFRLNRITEYMALDIRHPMYK